MYFFALALGVFTFTACDDDDTVDPIDEPEPQAYTILGTTDMTTLEDYDAATSTMKFYARNTYTLDGLVYVPSGMTLWIEEGTVIKANEVEGDGTTALIITQGAKIEAVGTPEEPIIFTSSLDNLSDPTDLTGEDNQLWGGVVLLGSAGISNKGSLTNNVEGIEANDNTLYGGTNDADDSGTLKYVSIRHTGAELSPGNELQGLTLGGVGSGTEIDYVESFASSDDGIEIFGGSVHIKHFAVAFSEDDCFDLDLGWQGSGQFLFAIKADDRGDAMAEWDGASPDDDPRYTNAAIANATFIGSGNNSSNGENDLAILMRDGFGGQLYNSIITGVNGYGIEVEDIQSSKDANSMDSYSKLVAGTLVISGNVFDVSRTTFDVNPTTGLINVTSDEGTILADDPTQAVLAAQLSANNSTATNVLNISSRAQGANGINPIPSTSVGSDKIATVPTSKGLVQVNYVGAFEPNGTNWMTGWTALSQLGYLAQ